MKHLKQKQIKTLGAAHIRNVGNRYVNKKVADMAE